MQRFWQRVTTSRQAAPPRCVFCDHATLETNGILYEDERVMAFRDKHPRATAHVLVVPKEHIATSADLTPTHATLVEHMLCIGKDVLHQECRRLGLTPTKEAVFGFHQPPFNSIDHLHLHCLVPPFLPSWNELRYIQTPLRNFITADTVLQKFASRNAPPSPCK
ncbi:hypothetical protein H310_11298 [Aphanomyces invadans]|uniref:HIT domain-containing protein n=1 Tax=Aphanomyces invadans TaxID=157072 RepID=A0A024TPA0_9STRA|nr:hypothetical protein H310_11298 [Aphanomyces invadans]ETV95426.1 hypothetical protein H310_11298 [Aphanomyces invadans]|eukprot:XP_008876127.1 hypothetical protein H310_11298 [Aphanomyces invadans]